MYKVKQSDLIGDVKDFPVEVVQKIFERQREQNVSLGIKKDYKKELRLIQRLVDGAFPWYCSKEGHHFWDSVIHHRNFDLFFQKYPKRKK